MKAIREMYKSELHCDSERLGIGTLNQCWADLLVRSLVHSLACSELLESGYYRVINLNWQKVLSFYSKTYIFFIINEVFLWSICLFVYILFYVKFALTK